MRPKEAAFVCLVMASSDGPGGALKLTLLAPLADAGGLQLTNTTTPLPDGSAFYPLPASGGTVAFVAIAVPKQMDRSMLVDSLARVASDLNALGRGALPRLPSGRTLWYDAAEGAWPAGADAGATAGARKVLDALGDKLQGIFENRAAALAGAAVSYSAD